jgi:hypothetical protein
VYREIETEREKETVRTVSRISNRIQGCSQEDQRANGLIVSTNQETLSDMYRLRRPRYTVLYSKTYSTIEICQLSAIPYPNNCSRDHYRTAEGIGGWIWGKIQPINDDYSAGFSRTSTVQLYSIYSVHYQHLGYCIL